MCKIFLAIAENHSELIVLVGSIEFTNARRRSMDVLGRVFEHLQAKSSPAPKSRVGGQFYHSSWVVKILTPRHGRTHDLRSGSGGMTRENLKGPGMESDSWLLTWTTYGTWLPGDERGFVGNVVESVLGNPPTGVGGSKAASLNIVPTVQADGDCEPQGYSIRAANASGLNDEAPPAKTIRAANASGLNDEAPPAKTIRAANASGRVTHNLPGTPYDRAMPGLRHHALQQMRGEPVWLDLPQASLFLEEARRVAKFRSWPLHAVAVMANHAHLVVTAPKGVPGERLLQEFKSYGSRELNRRFGERESGTWWTKSGSTRVLSHEKALRSAVEYVRNQHRPLVLWISDRFEPTGPNEREEA